jgi:hypothetical protein
MPSFMTAEVSSEGEASSTLCCATDVGFFVCVGMAACRKVSEWRSNKGRCSLLE